MSEDDKKECSCGIDRPNEKELSDEEMKEIAEAVYFMVKEYAERVNVGPMCMASVMSLLTARICDMNSVDRTKMVRVMLETPGEGRCVFELQEINVKKSRTDAENIDDPANAPN